MALAHVAASCSQPVPPHRPTRHAAAVGSGSWRPPSSLPAAAEARLCSPVPGGSVPPHALGVGCGFGAGWGGDGFQPPPPQVAAPCCNQTSLTFPLRVPALAGGDDSPAHSGISKPTALSSLLLFQLRLEGSERTRQEVGEEGESSPGAQQGGSRARSPAKAQLGTGREQKPLASTPDPQVRLHRAAASQ